MRRAFNTALVLALATEALVLGQGGDIAKILGEARQALGGDQKLAAVKTISAVGRNARTRPDGMSSEAEFEISVELPDKYMRRDVLMALGPTSIYRNSGFNGEGLINLTDTPPALSSGGNVRIMMAGPGGMPGQTLTPEQQAEAHKRTLAGYKQDFARLMLGMFATSFTGYPVEFTYGGQAESADGKADVLEVKGEGGFAAKLFIDAATHLPLMLSWMDKEPLVMSVSNAGGARGSGGTFTMGGGATMVQSARSGGAAPSREEMEQMQRDMAARMAEAEASREVVEYRLFYADYKSYDGVKVPTRIQQMVDGKPTQEILFDRIKLNAKIDPKTFQVTK